MDDWTPFEGDGFPEDLLAVVKPELQPGEKLLWVSRADQDGASRVRDGHAVASTWAVGLVAIGFGLTTFSDVPGGGPQLVPGFWASSMSTLGFMLAVLGATVGIFTLISLALTRWDRQLRARRVYALTDQRAIFWSPVSGTQAFTVRVFPRGSIKPELIERTEYPDGSGTLSLQGRFRDHGNFEGVAEVRRIEEMVRRYLVASDPSTTP